MPMKPRTLKEQSDVFYKNYKITDSGCWEWTGTKSGNDEAIYGRISYGRDSNGKAILAMAHRVSYLLHKGELIDGHHIHHECRNTLCVNPEHLEQLTPEEHVRKTEGCAGWLAAQMTHCPLGHELAGENLAIRNGYRSCRQCGIRRSKTYKSSKTFDRFTQERRLRSPQAEKTHCPLGHPYSGDNLKWRKDKHGSSRYCGSCNQIKANYQHLKRRKGIDISIKDYLANWQAYGLKQDPKICRFSTE